VIALLRHKIVSLQSQIELLQRENGTLRGEIVPVQSENALLQSEN
jgi:hypothetical protein